MRKMFFSSVLIVLSSFAFTAIRPVASDYRDSYVGSYFCNSSCQQINSEENGITNVTDTVTIGVTEDTMDSILDISVYQDVFKVKLKNGILYSYPPGSHWGGKFFSTDSIFLLTDITLGPHMCNYTGKKN